MDPLIERLMDFTREKRFSNKGALCVALVITRQAKKSGLPLDADTLLTEGGGQVGGLGKGQVQAILKEHGITRVLAEEGGRTSRGSVGNMRSYVLLLNELHQSGIGELDSIEGWWIERVKDFFAAKPFILRLDSSKSLRAIVQDLLAQAEKRQLESPGSRFTGAVLQHLVGAKLDVLLGGGIEHHGSSVADESSGRDSDFLISGYVAIHVTTAPGEAVIRKCKRNLDSSLRPVLVTTSNRVQVAQGLADLQGIGDRLDVFEAEQFLAGNLYELGRFAQSGSRDTAKKLVARYNEIVDMCETDPGLRIEMST